MKKILFYCSWGGFGHIARTYAVAKFIKRADVRVISAQPWIFPRSDNFEYFPMTEPGSRYRLEGEKIILQNYKEKADARGYAKHLFEFFELLKKNNPDLVVVDNPAEIAIYSMMLGYKTCIVWETLTTNDLRWRLVWKNCDKIIVPYGPEFAKQLKFRHKNIFFAGGYSRFEGETLQINRREVRHKLGVDDSEKLILFAVGKGFVDQNQTFDIAKVVSELGNTKVLFPAYEVPWLDRFRKEFPSIIIIRNETDLKPYLAAADIFIGGAGYNTMMEALEFNLPSIFIPLKRKFDEQYNKVKTIMRLGAGKAIFLEDKNWRKKLRKSLGLLSDERKIKEIKKRQRMVVDGHGAEREARILEGLVNQEEK